MSGERHYLAGLALGGRRVVVVGGGPVAQRRLPRLVAAGAAVELIAPDVTPGVQAQADRGDLTWVRRSFRDGDLAGSWYVLACTSDATVNERVVAEAEREHVFCVRSDAGAAGSAVTPAVGEHEGLAVGVLSGGMPRRSAAVRDRVLGALREGTLDASAPSGEGGGPRGVALVGGGPGDPELITVRGKRLLAQADVVVCDRLAPKELLEELPPPVEVVDASKIPYGRSASQDVINTTLVENARRGKFVVRLKGGDPFVFGRGFEELLACAEAGVPVTVVPGVTSAFAAPAQAGVPVTHRGVTHEVVVVSGHVGPDDERSLVDWRALASLRGTIVLLMGVRRIAEFAQVLRDGGRPAGTPVVVVADGTMASQRSLTSTLDRVATDIAESGIEPPAVIVIGPVAGLVTDMSVSGSGGDFPQ